MTTIDDEFDTVWGLLGAANPELRQMTKIFFIAGAIFGVERAAQLDQAALRAAVDDLRIDFGKPTDDSC